MFNFDKEKIDLSELTKRVRFIANGFQQGDNTGFSAFPPFTKAVVSHMIPFSQKTPYLLYIGACGEYRAELSYRHYGWQHAAAYTVSALLLLTDHEITVEGIGTAGVNTGDQREELSVLLDIDIRCFVLGHDLVIDDLIIDILPVVVDRHRVPYLQPTNVVEEDPADIVGMAGNGDIGAVLINGQ